VEANGLIKFDFLGLKTLTLIKHCLRLLAERGVEVDLEGVDLNDPLPYELMAKGDVTGVFQIENSGIRGMVARLKPTCIEDVIAIVALYRPGPLKSGMVDGFIKIKHGLERPHYELELIRPILEETLGVIVYQEQVMRIAQVLAGYSLGEADLLRRAMGKKKPEEMAKQMSRFMAGAAERGVPAEKAAKVFELMSYFAEYGFNKSHSAAYAMITYRTAWLKAHYPLEFMAALMTSEHDNLEKISGIIKECRKRGIPVRPPDVNASALKFTAAGDSIVFGLGAIKGVGQGAVEAILEARRDGPFEDIFDFCARAGNQKVNRRVIESLIKCGAFDACGGAPRESLLACLDEAMAAGAKTRQKKARPQASLFAGLEPPPKKARRWPEAVPMTEAERLGLEKDLLGFYISGHPLDRFEPAMAAVRDAPLSRVARLGDQSRVRVCGTLGKVVQKLSKNNKPYAFVTIEDSDASAELAVWSNVLSRRGTILTEGRLVVVDGVVDRNGEKDKSRQKIICDDIRDFGETLAKGIASLTIASPLSELDAVVDFLAARSDPGDQAAGDQAGAGPAGARQSGAGQEGASGAAPAETGTAAVFLGIDDGVGRAVYRLDRKVALSVEFFREADRLLPLEAAGSLRCSSSPYPFGANA
jgi:DNA polymerase-3 subunit alpha